MSTGGQIFGLFLVLALVVGFFGMLNEAIEESEAEIADFEPQEGEDADGDEDL